MSESICAKCKTANPADASTCNKCHGFLRANQVARTHGIYAQHRLPPEVKAQVDELRAGVIADRGGESELTTMERSHIDKLAAIEVTILLLANDIEANGLLTPGGRVRDVYPMLLAGLAAFDRYAQRIGLQRRAKRVPSLVEVMDE